MAGIGEEGGIEPPEAFQVTDTLSASRLPALARTGDGTIVLVWQEETPAGGGSAAPGFDVLLTRSIDRGGTWTPPSVVVVAAGSSPEPDVAVAGTTIGVAWLADRSPSVDVRFARVVCP